ncbi:hypothetical protein DYH09_19155 [bacterium CPR1]|nr:hypothetical protein [bacterium CPR1]
MEVPEGLDEEAREEYKYLLEVLEDYRRYVKDIGRLGLAAPNLLYYRDEVQESLDELRIRGVDPREVWVEVVALDNAVRARASEIVAEIGHANFKQYQIINSPPPSHWWWFLNRVVPGPAGPERPTWQFWKR